MHVAPFAKQRPFFVTRACKMQILITRSEEGRIVHSVRYNLRGRRQSGDS